MADSFSPAYTQNNACGASKKLTHHAAAVSLYVTHYNLCRVHEAIRTSPPSRSVSPSAFGPSAI
jgi:hypothetical protein